MPGTTTCEYTYSSSTMTGSICVSQQSDVVVVSDITTMNGLALLLACAVAYILIYALLPGPR